MNEHPQHLQKILVVNVNWLGDVIFSIPVFKNLRKQYPHARICCLAWPSVKEILQCVPEIDEVFVYDEKGKDRSLWGKVLLVQRIRQQKFDAVFLLHGSWSRAFLMFLAGIAVRVGYAGKGKEKILTHVVKPLNDQTHKADIYLNVIKAFGLKIDDKISTLCIAQETKEEVAEILSRKGIAGNEAFVVVHTSGNWDLKRWPKENWASLIRILTNDLGIKVVISEGPKEVVWAQEIARRSAVNPIVLAGETNLRQLFALLEKASIVISADSGPLHIASCVSKNIIGLYGPTMPWTTGPRGLARSVILHKQVGCNIACCYYQACSDNVCMKFISVSDVVSSVKEILEKENVGR
jgi:lipopolysaccharide heptosyltransferase II